MSIFSSASASTCCAAKPGALKVLRRTIYLDQSVLLSRNLTTFF